MARQTQFLNLSQQQKPLSATSSRVKAKDASESCSVFQFQNAKTFSQAKSPILSNQKREMIESKLALQRAAEASAAERLNNNRQFVRYNKNQFLDIGSQSYASQRSLYDFEDSEEDIVSAVNKLAQKQEFALNPELKARREEYTKISSAIGKVEKVATMPKNHQSQQQQQLTRKDLSFDQLVTLPEQKCTTYREINIFRAVRMPQQSMGIEQLLNRHHFHFSGLSNYNSKLRVPIESHLSSSSRKTLLRNDKVIQSKFDVLSPSQTNISLDQILLDNLLGIASGRISSQLAFNSIHQSSAPSSYEQSTSLTNAEEIIFPENTSNRAVSFKNQDFQRDQVQNYLRQQLTQQEKKTFKKYDDLAKLIKMQLQTRNQVVKQRINDRSLHQKMEGEIHQNLSYLLSLQEKKERDVERVISRNKQHKDRNTSYRNKLIVSSLQQKKDYDALLKDIIRQRPN